MLQFRPVGDAGWKSTPFYAPSRDLAYCGTGFIASALTHLDSKLESKDPELMQLLDKLQVSKDDLISAARKLSEFFKNADADKPTDVLLREFNVTDLTDKGLIVLFVFIGMYITAAIFSGVRDLTEIPANVRAFTDMVDEAVSRA